MANLAMGLTIADRSYVIDNSGKHRRLLVSRESGQVKHLAKVMPAWAANAIPDELRRFPASGSAI
jgi:predicted ABC-type ATPase